MGERVLGERDPAQTVRGHGRRDPGGAALLLTAVVAVIGTVLVVALASLGSTLQARVRAQTAADAAALASLTGGRQGAVISAGRHAATLISWQRGPGPGEVTVSVIVDGQLATARASNAP